jgi:phage shock protein C
MTQTKQFYRRPKEGKIFGVIAGFADYLSVDVTLLRIVAVVLVFAGVGIVIPIYIALAIFLPVANNKSEHESTEQKIHVLGEELKDNRVISQSKNYLAAGLIVVGVWLLLVQLFPQVFSFNWDVVWPIIIIIVGIALLTGIRGRKNG